jgi:hypothetical protein
MEPVVDDIVEPTLRARLSAVRASLEAAIDSAEPRELPALSREYRAVLGELEALPSDTSAATVDELREQRAQRLARRAAAADSARSAEL